MQVVILKAQWCSSHMGHISLHVREKPGAHLLTLCSDYHPTDPCIRSQLSILLPSI